ncbi:hypothetical protein LCGC14_0927180 [marine sediment metagenome]|uniref:Uncharacterized protein n=1 Tax=marine sediment metagenome TaxID=412755 RepID=A0A0F9R7Q3_9ZZZZ
MALLHIEGFEVADGITTYLDRKLVSGSNANEWVTGRFGGKAARVQYPRGFGWTVNDEQTLIIGFALNFETLEYEWPFLTIFDGGTEQISLAFGLNGALRVVRDGNAIAFAYNLITRRAWHYIELKIKIHNTTGTAEVHVDGVEVINETGLDTQMSANASANVIIFWSARFETDSLYDDIYIANDSGSYNNDFLGDVRIVTTKPDADGSSTDFTLFPGTGESHYQDVDDGSSVDDDTTYIESAVATNEDLFSFEDLVDTGSILGVQIFTDAKESAGSESLGTSVRTFATDHDDTPQAVTAAYLIYSRIMDVEPENTIPWTSTVFNASTFGVKVG